MWFHKRSTWLPSFYFSSFLHFLSQGQFSFPSLSLSWRGKRKKKRWRGKKSKKSTTWVFPLSGPRPGIREGEKIIELEGLKVSQTGRRARPKISITRARRRGYRTSYSQALSYPLTHQQDTSILRSWKHL